MWSNNAALPINAYLASSLTRRQYEHQITISHSIAITIAITITISSHLNVKLPLRHTIRRLPNDWFSLLKNSFRIIRNERDHAKSNRANPKLEEVKPLASIASKPYLKIRIECDNDDDLQNANANPKSETRECKWGPQCVRYVCSPLGQSIYISHLKRVDQWIHCYFFLYLHFKLLPASLIDMFISYSEHTKAFVLCTFIFYAHIAMSLRIIFIFVFFFTNFSIVFSIKLIPCLICQP